jgi:hypothetical protein
MRITAALLLFALFTTACGKKMDLSSQEKTMSEAQAQIDKGHYEKAITTLEALRMSHPNNEEIKIKLLHSYAGAGSFEAMKVVSIWKEIEILLDDYKKQQKEKLKASAKLGLDNFASELEKVLAPIPELSSQQKVRLTQAIELYQELGFKVETAGKYNNFKWGTLHIYRLAVNLKELVQETKRLQHGSDKLNLKAIEKAMVPRLKVLGQDIFMAYKLYANSFDKIKKITESIDKIIAKTVKDESFKLKINTLARSEGEFFKCLLKDNIDAASVLIRKLADIYHENGHKEKLDSLLKKALPSEEEVKKSQKRIETVVKLFINNFTEEHPEFEEKLKSIFNEKLKQEVIAAVKESIKVKNTSPLKELMSSKSPEIEVLNSYYLILKEEIKASEVEEEIREELDSLRSKVDLEMLKSELKIIAAELKIIAAELREDSKVVELGAEALVHKNRDLLQERKETLEKEIKWLEKYLGDLTADLKQSKEAENPDQEEMNEIIIETKTFVDS